MKGIPGVVLFSQNGGNCIFGIKAFRKLVRKKRNIAVLGSVKKRADLTDTPGGWQVRKGHTKPIVNYKNLIILVI